MVSVFNNNVCRLCLWESVSCIPIFSENGGETVLSRRILALVQIAVSQEDAFPKVICHACVYKLEMFNNFQANCLQCDNMLKNYIGPAHIHTSAPVHHSPVVHVAPVVEEEQSHEAVKVEVVDWMDETEEEQEPNTTITSDVHNTLHEEPSTSTAHAEVYTAPQQTSNSAVAQVQQDSKQEPQSSVTRRQSNVKEDHVTETDSVLESSNLDSRTTRMQERTSSSTQVTPVEANGSGMVSSSSIDLKKPHHICKVCKRLFKTSYHLNKHHLSKHTQKNFVCEYCDKTFSHFQLLTNHKAIHLEYKYSCQVCFKKFNSLSSLKYHVEHKCVTAAISNDHRYASHAAAPPELEEEVEQGSFIQADFDQNVTKTEVADPETTVDINKEEVRCELCGLDFKSRSGLGRHKTGHYHSNREAVLKSHERTKVAIKGTPRKTKLCKLVKKNTAQGMSGLRVSRIKKAKQLGNIRAKRALKAQLTKQSKYKHKHIDTPCDVCGKVFVSLVGMYIHRTVTHGKKPV